EGARRARSRRGLSRERSPGRCRVAGTRRRRLACSAADRNPVERIARAGAGPLDEEPSVHAAYSRGAEIRTRDLWSPRPIPALAPRGGWCREVACEQVFLTGSVIGPASLRRPVLGRLGTDWTPPL